VQFQRTQVGFVVGHWTKTAPRTNYEAEAKTNDWNRRPNLRLYIRSSKRLEVKDVATSIPTLMNTQLTSHTSALLYCKLYLRQRVFSQGGLHPWGAKRRQEMQICCHNMGNLSTNFNVD